MYEFKLVLNLEKDMRNRWDACNKVSHGVDWKQRIDKNISDEIVWKTEKEASDFLWPYLEQYYKDHDKVINTLLFEWQNLINKKIDRACKTLENVVGKPMYRTEFIWFLTTFPRWPYSYQKWYLWLYYNRPVEHYMGTFLHELLHFQFIHYYKDIMPVTSLTKKQFEILKESMTVILNHECREFLWKPDDWYPIHQEYRVQLDNFWKQNKNFADLVVFWADLVKDEK